MMKKMAIITSYFDGESYGLLGPQMAATVIQENTPFECIVIAVTHSDDKAVLTKALFGYFGKEMPIVGFSSLNGREDIFLFAKALKAEGAITFLAGPQSDVDFLGETGWRDYPHRFRGFSEAFSFALQGPAEQVFPVLEGISNGQWKNASGLLYTDDDCRIVQTPRQSWKNKFLRRVRWNNLYRVGQTGLENLTIISGQVIQHIGCPHAAQAKPVELVYPYHLDSKGEKRIRLKLKGCSFCDVSSDKGFHGALDLDTVLSQIACLPEDAEGRTISFELINENALPGLHRLIQESSGRGMSLSQIKLTLRADWFLSNENHLREALHLARKLRIRILLSSIGFESFDDRILRNLNKGLTVKTNIDAILLMRRLKKEFPLQWAYSNRDGAIHGLIHPTPWDSPETDSHIQQITASCHIHLDILPAHSVPLIIHHASGLADWIREIETSEEICFERYVSVIGWWNEALLKM